MPRLPATSSNSPSPPATLASPRSPITRSAPPPPSTSSLPRPPWIRSSPGPPQSRSLPRLPEISSSPPPPQITSRSGVPRSTSSPGVPTISARRPWQRGVSSSGVSPAPSASTVKSAASAATAIPLPINLIRRAYRSKPDVPSLEHPYGPLTTGTSRRCGDQADWRALFEVDHHVLDLGVVLERVHREVLAVAGLLVAAVGHLGDERDVVVDPDAAEAQRVGDPHGAADVAGPDRGGEAVAGAVDFLEQLRVVAERLHGDHRAEDLLLDHLVALFEPGDDGRLEEVAGKVGLGAAGDHLGVAGPALEEALDPLALALRVERPQGRVGGERVAENEALGFADQAVDDIVVDPFRGQHPGRRGAVLAAVVVAGAGDRLDRGLHLDIVEDDDRGLAAELEVDALERLGGGLGDALSGRRRDAQARPP